MNKDERYIAAGHSKDVAAGGVLILAICSAIIGLIIFIPKILLLIWLMIGKFLIYVLIKMELYLQVEVMIFL